MNKEDSQEENANIKIGEILSGKTPYISENGSPENKGTNEVYA